MEKQAVQPKNIFEQILYGMQTINDNIFDLYKMVEEIRAEKESEAKLSEEDKIKLEHRKALAEQLKARNKV